MSDFDVLYEPAFITKDILQSHLSYCEVIIKVSLLFII